MAKSIAGKLIGVTVNGVAYRCQTDATLNLTTSVTEDDPCKPDIGSDDDESVGWVTRTVDSKDWSISFSAKEFADGLGANGAALARLFIDTDLSVEAQFMSNPTQGVGTVSQDFLYEGDGLLTSLTINSAVAGSATYDAEITGNGPLSLTQIVRTT